MNQMWCTKFRIKMLRLKFALKMERRETLEKARDEQTERTYVFSQGRKVQCSSNSLYFFYQMDELSRILLMRIFLQKASFSH